MTFEPGIVTGTLGCVLSVLVGIFVRRAQIVSVRGEARTRAEREVWQSGQASQMAGLERQMESLEISMRDADEILREDRLNHSTRARALQVLRSGISPDSAAASLGMPREELRLLGKVSRLLGAYR